MKKTLSEWGFSWKGLIDNRKGEWYLMAQILFIGAHLLPAWPTNKIQELLHGPIILKAIGTFLFIGGLFLAVKSLWDLGRNLSPLPEPKENSQLVTNGIYRYSRHPLYLSLLIMSMGVTLIKGSLLHLLLLIGLCFLLIKKARREELKLKEVFIEYTSYMDKTPLILPKVYKHNWGKWL